MLAASDFQQSNFLMSDLESAAQEVSFGRVFVKFCEQMAEIRGGGGLEDESCLFVMSSRF